MRAGRVVVAVPLTALQSGDLAFSPPLPARKQVRSAPLDGRVTGYTRMPASLCATLYCCLAFRNNGLPSAGHGLCCVMRALVDKPADAATHVMRPSQCWHA